jgi:hypothetical protein
VSTPLHERTDVYQVRALPPRPCALVPNIVVKVAFITVKGASFLAVASSNAFQVSSQQWDVRSVHAHNSLRVRVAVRYHWKTEPVLLPNACGQRELE